ncbi:MAG: hypothetical protein ACJ8C4_09075 [Gemmataceae bacterium]
MASGFAGTWQTNYGQLNIEIEGDQVYGTYGNLGGEIEGVVGGNRATGKWNQQAANSHGATWGDFVLILQRNGEQFSGQWTYGDDMYPEGGVWSGTKIGGD